jgi:ElaA protein
MTQATKVLLLFRAWHAKFAAMQIDWQLKSFEELTPYQLYAILQLRNEVFVVEQNCIFQDADDKDQNSWHFMGFQNNRLVAYTRLIPAGESYDEASIGRVVTSPTIRSTGAGKELMQLSVEMLYKLFGKQPIKIGAQLYLKKFYEAFGFYQCSDIYLEDGIEHILMLKA